MMKFTNNHLLKNGQMCSVCGEICHWWWFAEIINVSLQAAWKLSDQEKLYFDLRESLFCPFCNSSMRSRLLADMILRTFNLPDISLNDWVKLPVSQKLSVAEVSQAGNLHEYLNQLQNLSYSENDSNDPNIALQDLTKLSYLDNSFDLLIHSEVIEHIADFESALKESLRVINQSGCVIFTTPVLWSRNSLQVADKINGEIVSHATPSFHGAGEAFNRVFWEWGGDFVEICEKLEVYFDYIDPHGAFVIRKIQNNLTKKPNLNDFSKIYSEFTESFFPMDLFSKIKYLIKKSLHLKRKN